MDRDHTQSSVASRPNFQSTRWSIVLQARAPGDSIAARNAMATLCESYWLPIYVFARRRGNSEHDAQDLTQGFFAKLLEKDAIANARPDRGRFRSFLLASFRNFLANEWDYRTAKKRGGQVTTWQMNFADAEEVFDVTTEEDAEKLFERQWVAAILGRVMVELRDDAKLAGNERQFEVLKDFIAGRNPGRSYRDAAAELTITEAAAMTAVSRLRRKYRERIYAAVADTVSDPSEIEDEIRELFASLA